MPVTPAAYGQLVSEFNSLVYNPSQRFFTAGDILNYLNRAAVETASQIGGVRITDSTNLSVALQRDYVVDSGIRRVDGIWYIQNFGQTNEVRTPLDVITKKDQDVLNRIGYTGYDWCYQPPSSTPPAQPTAPVPQVAIFQPELSTLSLLPIPQNSGDTVWIDCLAVPSALGNGVTYNGDALDTGAIVLRAVAYARVKSREYQESKALLADWKDACMGIKVMRSKERRRRQLGDGRQTLTRLRSVNGAE